MKIKIFTYKSDYNTAIIKTINAEQIPGTKLCYEKEQDPFSGEKYNYYFCVDSTENLFFCIGKNSYQNIEQITNWYSTNKVMLSKEFLINSIREKIKNKQYTNNLETLICQTFGFDELAKECQKNKMAILQEREQERKQKELEREQIEMQRQQEQQEKERQKVENAKQKMFSGNFITNEEFEKLCKQYNIELSIKFLGWLREHCGNIKIVKEDNPDKIAFYKEFYKTQYYYNKGHKSTSICKYTNALASAMKI